MLQIMRKVCAWLVLVWILVLSWCTSSPTSEVAQEPEPTVVEIVTEYGTMEAVLYDSTPGHRDNFVQLASTGFYNDLLFHRVIQWFMIQWWDPDSRGAPGDMSLWRGGPWYQIDAEIGAPHFKWTLAAARTWGSSNPEKRSSGSQFYIVHWTPQTLESLQRIESQKWIKYTPEEIARYVEVWGAPMLDAEYTVFGEVTAWLDVIDAIAVVQTWRGDRPVEDVTMEVRVK